MAEGWVWSHVLALLLKVVLATDMFSGTLAVNFVATCAAVIIGWICYAQTTVLSNVRNHDRKCVCLQNIA